MQIASLQAEFTPSKAVVYNLLGWSSLDLFDF